MDGWVLIIIISLSTPPPARRTSEGPFPMVVHTTYTTSSNNGAFERTEGYVNVLVYSLIALYACVQLVFVRRDREERRRSRVSISVLIEAGFDPRTVSHVFLILSILARVTIIVCHIEGWEDKERVYSFVGNRLSLLCGFTTYWCIVLYWMEALKATQHMQELQPKRFKMVFVLSNLFAWVFELTVVFVVIGTSRRSNNRLYDASVMCIAFLHFLLSVSFLWIGIRLFRLITRSVSGRSGKMLNFMRRMGILTIVCVLSFGLRFILFSYRIVTGKYFTHTWGRILYPYFFYNVPEVLTAVAVLYALAPRSIRRNVSEAYERMRIVLSRGTSSEFFYFTPDGEDDETVLNAAQPTAPRITTMAV